MLIVRNYGPEQATGKLHIINKKSAILYTCFSLELPDLDNQKNISCIPEGVYQAVKHISPKFGETFWLPDVKNRSEILIHAGNFVTDTLGCILVGEALRDINNDGLRDVFNSRKALETLYEIMPDEFKLCICKSGK